MATRIKTALAAAAGAGVAAVAVLALSSGSTGPASATVPPDSTETTGSTPDAPTEPGNDVGARTITVTGHGTVSVVPDIADLMAGVQANAPTATEALDQISTSSKALIDTLNGVGIEEKDIQTSGLSLWPTFGRDGTEITGYQASTNVTATIRDVTKVGSTVDALKTLVGENLTLNGISFSYDEPETVLGDARADAVANAKVRAGQYAEAADVEVGAVVRIIEGSVSDPTVFRGMAESADAAGSMAIAPGSQELAADVTVVFEMR